jgi:hypothetical protein
MAANETQTNLRAARKGRKGGAIALVSLVALVATSTPALASETSSARGRCGNPVIDVWYDSDQYGRYMKVDFGTAKGCPRGRKVFGLAGKIWCRSGPKKGDVVYFNRTSGKAPLSTITKSLPPKRKCGSFYAESQIRFVTQDYLDEWHWKWGNYPA